MSASPAEILRNRQPRRVSFVCAGYHRAAAALTPPHSEPPAQERDCSRAPRRGVPHCRSRTAQERYRAEAPPQKFHPTEVPPRRSPTALHPQPTAASSHKKVAPARSGGHHKWVRAPCPKPVWSPGLQRPSTNPARVQDRTSANSFSKNCLGRAPMTVLLTSPPWNR
jgi:hypothetical protein